MNSVAFSPDGKILAAGSADDTIRLWDVATRRPLGPPLTGHTDTVNRVAFSPDGTILASATTTGRSACGTWPPVISWAVPSVTSHRPKFWTPTT